MVALDSFEYETRERFGFLCVDSFIENIVDARALGTAFELHLIDYLNENTPSSLEDIQKEFNIDSRGLELLLDLLAANRVIEKCNGEIRLSRTFQKALQYRDLLEAKMAFANYVVPDFTELFTSLIHKPDRFFRQSRIIDLFGYNRCFEYTRENYELTKRWMRITTSLTKYEARACMAYHDFTPYRQILDIGGNSGEFALRICRAYPHIRATVFDLPVVCDIGQEHIRPEPEADRISFIKGNALTDSLPEDFDLVSFKSMLHDWPEKEALQFIARASRSLRPGGTLLIFERGPFEIKDESLPYSMIPFLLFFRSFRSPEIYTEYLEALGFQDITTRRIDLEMPFFLVTGRNAPNS